MKNMQRFRACFLVNEGDVELAQQMLPTQWRVNLLCCWPWLPRFCQYLEWRKGLRSTCILVTYCIFSCPIIKCIVYIVRLPGGTELVISSLLPLLLKQQYKTTACPKPSPLQESPEQQMQIICLYSLSVSSGCQSHGVSQELCQNTTRTRCKVHQPTALSSPCANPA